MVGMSANKLDDKVAVVTGAGRGIGFEIAQWLAEAGARVGIVDIHEQELDRAVQQLIVAGYTALALRADVSDKLQVKAMIDRVFQKWGRIDILVNNAGICPLTPVLEITPDEWDRVLEINLKGAFLCSQAAIPVMNAQQSGKIINIASSAGQMGGIAVGLHYSASKAGLLGLTKSLARMLAPRSR